MTPGGQCDWATFCQFIAENIAALFFPPLLQIKYAGADTDATSPPPFCHQISTDEFEYQRATSFHGPLAALLEEIAMNKEISVKDKKKQLKQVNKDFSRVFNLNLNFEC